MKMKIRVSITPDCIPSLIKMGFKVYVESDAGVMSSYTNDDYKKNGAKISTKLTDLYSKADIIVKIQKTCKKQKNQ